MGNEKKKQSYDGFSGEGMMVFILFSIVMLITTFDYFSFEGFIFVSEQKNKTNQNKTELNKTKTKPKPKPKQNS